MLKMLKMLIWSFICAFKGIAKAIASERNLKIMLVYFAAVIAFGLLFGLGALEWSAALLSCGVMFGIEMLNTALECTVDLMTGQNCELAGKAKDIAAGASLTVSIFALIIHLIIFIPHAVSVF
jgi:diacylglycerol kinase